MGSYLSKNITDDENVITLADCKTQEDCAELFINFNDIHPDEYCKLALIKLKNIDDSQNKALNEVIVSNIEPSLKWRSYCSILNMQQINYVGW